MRQVGRRISVSPGLEVGLRRRALAELSDFLLIAAVGPGERAVIASIGTPRNRRANAFGKSQRLRQRRHIGVHAGTHQYQHVTLVLVGFDRGERVVKATAPDKLPNPDLGVIIQSFARHAA